MITASADFPFHINSAVEALLPLEAASWSSKFEHWTIYMHMEYNRLFDDYAFYPESDFNVYKPILVAGRKLVKQVTHCLTVFLSAPKHLYNWLCPSVGWSVWWSVTH